MSQSTYEDIQREREIMQLFLKHVWNPKVGREDIAHHYGDRNSVDGYIGDGREVLRWVEVKGRKHLPDKYDSTIYSVRKWNALTMAEAGNGAPGMFLAGYSDDTIRWVLNRSLKYPLRAIIMGRKDRGLANDEEPCFAISHSDMGIWRPSDETETQRGTE